MVPGWQGIDVPVPTPILDALRVAHRRGARLLSICSGAFVLAATGLLAGKRATTHWRYAAELQRRHPDIEVNADVLYLDEGQILTSAGSAAGLDLCLHLVRRDFGAAVANQVARRLVIPPHRDGGQAQFIDSPVDRRQRNPLSTLLERVQRELHLPVSVEALAKRSAMSERTFLRRFRATTGMTPADWITRARVSRAREMLECTELTVKEIAVQAGLGSPMTLRHHFRKKVGLSPIEYRRRFSRASSRNDR